MLKMHGNSSQDFNIQALLKAVVQNGASDLHLVPRSKPQMRIDGSLKQFGSDELSSDEILNLCYALITDTQKSKLQNEKELDFALSLDDIGRFRANYYYTLNGELSAAFRVIAEKIPSLEQLKAPEILKELTRHQKGLILVTGATGSGKSTTLAAMLNEINERDCKHILTIEDPVEFIHESKKSLFSHRNVGADTLSYARALKYALREDPDVILVGEMRDAETISTAITAAETGHLVMGTLHTGSAIQSITRMIDSFEASEQVQVRNMLSNSLLAVISQTLVPKIGGGRLSVHEILINTAGVANLIRENKLHQIYSQMQLGQQQSGMQTQTQALVRAIRSGLITKENALRYCNNTQELSNLITGI